MTGSSGERLSADIDDMLSVADWVRTTAQDFHNDVEKLIGDVQSLMDKWRGSAADTHQTAWDEWAVAARNLVGALADDAAALRSGAITFRSTDSGSAGRLDAAAEGLA
ncbi:WXG100 family type VII secretion target [Nocardia sp. NPDC051030]|uniref:WXG100 family type VII secretion target n=1 Tax=Nocardia sp. NPDC051030 TaxID=3155162 RepID=UPI00341C294D